MNLPSPLTADDQLHFPKHGAHEVIKLTAGVHRQTWVSGIALFVDVYAANRSRHKTIKKLEVHLEKATTFYDHAPACTHAEVANHLRLPDRTEKEIVAKTTVRRSRHGWPGILPQSHDERTCSLVVPPGLVTIDTGM